MALFHVRTLDSLIESEFRLYDDIKYLNHAAVAPLPARAGVALKSFVDECVSQGAIEYPRWMVIESELKAQLARLVGATSKDEIALTKNTSEALSFVAHGFPWYEGDNVVISDEEFPSNRIVWESLAPLGVSVKKVHIQTADDPEQALLDACDGHTRLLSISSVQYASGLRIDLEKLGRHCKQKGIAFCVDAIQGLGVIPHDVDKMNIDFLMADGHKWMLGPEGQAVFYCREKWLQMLSLHEFGWHMTETYHDFDETDWSPAASARRFECGSPNMLGTVALHASLSLIEEVTIPKIESLVKEKCEFLFDSINSSPYLELLTRTDQGRYAGIVVFKHKEKDSSELYQVLMNNKVVCAPRGGGIRFSPHFYTDTEILSEALEIVLKD